MDSFLASFHLLSIDLNFILKTLTIILNQNYHFYSPSQKSFWSNLLQSHATCNIINMLAYF